MDRHIIVLLTRILYQVTLSKPLNILEGISISQYYWAKQEKSSGCALSDLLSRITLKLKRGHSITTWTKFFPVLTTYALKWTMGCLHHTANIFKVFFTLFTCVPFSNVIPLYHLHLITASSTVEKCKHWFTVVYCNIYIFTL